MRFFQRTASLFLAVWIALAPVKAWAGSMTLLGAGSAGAAATYVGPADIAASPKVWWGLRAMSAATAGTRAINLCDDTGANCTDILTNATTGRLNSPGTLGSNDCTTSNTCRVATLYDQSGALNCTGAACNLTQGTNSNRPTLTWNCINSLPCLVFTSTQTMFAATGNFTAVNQIYSVSYVGSRSVVGGQTVSFISSTAQFGFSSSANTARVFSGAGASIGNVTDGSWHAFNVVLNGASSTFFCGGSVGASCSNGGTSTTINPGTGAIGGAQINISGGGAGPTYQWNESGVWSADNTSVRSALNSNQLSFWGPF